MKIFNISSFDVLLRCLIQKGIFTWDTVKNGKKYKTRINLQIPNTTIIDFHDSWIGLQQNFADLDK